MTADQKEIFNRLNNLPFTILFIEGNHDNYDMLNNLEIKEWNNGNVQFIRNNIIHLMRGQVFIINDKKFFTFGGAKSQDIKDGILDMDDINYIDKLKFYKKTNKMFRVNHLSWWKEELPSEMEIHNALNVLEENDWKVDYIITHDCPINVLHKINSNYKTDILNSFLSMIEESTNYNKWYFGHHHINKNITDKHICLYDKIIKLK